MRRFLLLLCTFLIVGAAHADSFIERLLDRRVPGGVAVVDLGNAPQAPRATFQDRPVMVLRDGERWIAVVGIPLDAGKGPVDLKVTGGTQPAVSIDLGNKRYAEQHIKLTNQRQVDPNPDDQRRIARELEEQRAAYRIFTPGTPSNMFLDRPVDGGRLSSPFGLRRVFNGQPRNPHSGLDFAVPSGTPIKAPAAGRVILVGDYFFNGKTVFVDHGQGMISMFCHLSVIDVKVGDVLPRGGLVGKVGSTGRSTGPHLHWNVSLNDVRVDPAIFIDAYKP